MYKFDKNKKKELLKGRTIQYCATELIDCNRPYLNSILNEKSNCGRKMAYRIIHKLDDDNKGLNYYFMKEVKNV